MDGRWPIPAATSRELFISRIWGEERLGLCPLKTLPDPEYRLAVTRDEQEPVLHGTGEIIGRNLADNGCKLPAGTGTVHPGPETLQPVFEFGEGNFHAGKNWGREDVK